jgi:hypothetical protein
LTLSSVSGYMALLFHQLPSELVARAGYDPEDWPM